MYIVNYIKPNAHFRTDDFEMAIAVFELFKGKNKPCRLLKEIPGGYEVINEYAPNYVEPKKIQIYRKTLENQIQFLMEALDEHGENEYYRGLLDAYRAILKVGE